MQLIDASLDPRFCRRPTWTITPYGRYLTRPASHGVEQHIHAFCRLHDICRADGGPAGERSVKCTNMCFALYIEEVGLFGSGRANQVGVADRAGYDVVYCYYYTLLLLQYTRMVFDVKP